MKKLFIIFLLLIFCMTIVEEKSFAQKINKSIDNNRNRPIKLFNGRTLEGWYTFLKDRGRDNDLKEVFTVKDGMIRISGEEWGCITTDNEYENYKLVLDFKWGGQTFDPRADKTRDSGILLHSQGNDGGYSATWMNSIECQIIEGGTGDFIVVGDGSENFSFTAKVISDQGKPPYFYHPDGEPITINSGRINWYARDPGWIDQLGFRGKKDVENEVGEWNRIECIAVDDKISIYLEGVLVNESYNVRPRRGKIQIQSEGAEIFIRKVELTPLSRKQIINIHANNGKGVGTKIKIMPEWNAFGFFTSYDKIECDEVEVPESNTYTVYLEWSVSDDAAGKPYILQIGKTKLKGIVNKSGSWEEFRTIKIGIVKLKEGKYQTSFKPQRNH
jgi:hypothetical protein